MVKQRAWSSRRRGLQALSWLHARNLHCVKIVADAPSGTRSTREKQRQDNSVFCPPLLGFCAVGTQVQPQFSLVNFPPGRWSKEGLPHSLQIPAEPPRDPAPAGPRTSSSSSVWLELKASANLGSGYMSGSGWSLSSISVCAHLHWILSSGRPAQKWRPQGGG